MLANSEDPDQTPHYYAVSALGLHYLPMSHKKDDRLIWDNHGIYSQSHIRQFTISYQNSPKAIFQIQ